MNPFSSIAENLRQKSPAEGLVPDSGWVQLAACFQLSRRELAVAQLLFQDHGREQIALALRKPNGDALSPETVRVYIDRLFAKMNVASSIQFVQRVLQTIESIKCHRFCDGSKLPDLTTVNDTNNQNAQSQGEPWPR